MSFNNQVLDRTIAALEKKEASASLTDGQIDIRLQNIDGVISHLEEGDAKLLNALMRKREDLLSLRLSRDCEKMLEKHTLEWDAEMRPIFQRGLKWKLRPRRLP